MARPNPAIDPHGSLSFPGGATIDQDGTLEQRTRLFHNIARKYIAGYREGVKGTEGREKGDRDKFLPRISIPEFSSLTE
jgi:hypothetical protein